MDISTPIEVDSGASQSNQQQQHSAEFLVHACQCRDISCQSLECVKLKGIIAHVKVCRVRTSGKCPICTHLVDVCTNHSSNCRSPTCPVPFCSKIKQRLQETNGESVESTMETAVNEVFASDDSSSSESGAAAAAAGISNNNDDDDMLLRRARDALGKSVFGFVNVLNSRLKQQQQTESRAETTCDEPPNTSDFFSNIFARPAMVMPMIPPPAVPFPGMFDLARFAAIPRWASAEQSNNATDDEHVRMKEKLTQLTDRIRNKIRQSKNIKPHSSAHKHTSSMDLLHKIIRDHHPRQQQSSDPSGARSRCLFRLLPMTSSMSSTLVGESAATPGKSAYDDYLKSQQEYLTQLRDTISCSSDDGGMSLQSRLIGLMVRNRLIMTAFLRHRELIRQLGAGLAAAPTTPSQNQLSSQIAAMSLSEDQNAEVQQMMDMFQNLNLPEEQKQKLENVIVNQLAPNNEAQPDANKNAQL